MKEVTLFIKLVIGVVTFCHMRNGNGKHDYCKRCIYYANYKGRDMCRYDHY